MTGVADRYAAGDQFQTGIEVGVLVRSETLPFNQMTRVRLAPTAKLWGLGVNGKNLINSDEFICH